MADVIDPPGGWTQWATGADGRLVLAYRPDVFDGAAFPPECLPTLYLTHGKRTRRPGQNPTDRTGTSDWFVTFYLEPEVTVESPTRFDHREPALEYTLELATEFDDGAIDPRAVYQLPRERYLDKLAELVA